MKTRRVLDTPFVNLTAKQKEKRLKTQKHRDWPTINPGRTVVVSAVRTRAGAIEGFAFRCLNCDERKQFLSVYFRGDDNAEAVTRARAFEHHCNGQKWAPCRDAS